MKEMIPVIVLASVSSASIGIIGKIVFDWLSVKKNGNNHLVVECRERLSGVVNSMNTLNNMHVRTEGAIDKINTIKDVTKRTDNVLQTITGGVLESNLHLKDIKRILETNMTLLQTMVKNGGSK